MQGPSRYKFLVEKTTFTKFQAIIYPHYVKKDPLKPAFVPIIGRGDYDPNTLKHASCLKIKCQNSEQTFFYE